ncbi:phage protein NinX family protein [Phytopseudomonas seleniipraecipitans]|uniref:LysM domain-containing protein n=1 Tax=Phytopseudomonas seleniipraecipitans TaxID=640205 RepID=A0A1G7JF85_9GAMM|nr:phage protein NinX family protein [Pseudomonas seleniipraecipitans]SDF23543.1 Protein of unknown function [Pseudomonas seleniipraecipitans]
MTQLTEVQTSTLTAGSLAWAVGTAEGLDMYIKPGQYGSAPGVFANISGRAIRWWPEQDAAQAWPLLVKHGRRERLHLDFQCNGASYLEAGIRCGHKARDMLTAAMRAIVSMQLGPVALIPAELVPQRTYTTNPGESVMGIALRELKDEKRWTEIRDHNAEAHPDMGPHDYYPVGTVLAMPEGGAA